MKTCIVHTFLFILPRYLVARENNESAAPVAFAHFRYDMDYDDEVVYVYEIQGWRTKNACPGLRESRAFCRILTGCVIHNTIHSHNLRTSLFVQLEECARRKGLGKFMMMVLELLSHKADMRKIMLTCFKHNPLAYKFFKVMSSVNE